jgi:hypothetical protein
MLERSAGSVAAIALLLAGCQRPRAQSSAADAGVTPVPSELAQLCRALPAGMAFSECNDPPASPNFADCRRFELRAVRADGAGPAVCPPPIALSITGYPGLAQSLELTAAIDDARPHRIDLRLARPLLPPSGNLAPGTLLGTLRFLPVKGSELLPGPGLRAYTNKLSILEASVLADGG